jgi:hypothetical protein
MIGSGAPRWSHPHAARWWAVAPASPMTCVVALPCRRSPSGLPLGIHFIGMQDALPSCLIRSLPLSKSRASAAKRKHHEDH